MLARINQPSRINQLARINKTSDYHNVKYPFLIPVFIELIGASGFPQHAC